MNNVQKYNLPIETPLNSILFESIEEEETRSAAVNIIQNGVEQEGENISLEDTINSLPPPPPPYNSPGSKSNLYSPSQIPLLSLLPSTPEKPVVYYQDFMQSLLQRSRLIQQLQQPTIETFPTPAQFLHPNFVSPKKRRMGKDINMMKLWREEDKEDNDDEEEEEEECFLPNTEFR